MKGIRIYTSLMVSNEVSVLQRLHCMLEAESVVTRESFRDLMRAAFEYGRLEPRGLSNDLGYSLTTVCRWIKGRSTPDPILWPRVVEWVMQAIRGRIAGAELDRQVALPPEIIDHPSAACRTSARGPTPRGSRSP